MFIVVSQKFRKGRWINRIPGPVLVEWFKVIAAIYIKACRVFYNKLWKRNFVKCT